MCDDSFNILEIDRKRFDRLFIDWSVAWCILHSGIKKYGTGGKIVHPNIGGSLHLMEVLYLQKVAREYKYIFGNISCGWTIIIFIT